MACTEFSSDNNFYIKRWNLIVLCHFENHQVFLPHPVTVFICRQSSFCSLPPLAVSFEIMYCSCTSFSHVTLLWHFTFKCCYNCSPCTQVQPFPTLFWLLSLDVLESLVLPVVIYWASSFVHLLMLCSNLISPSCNLHASVWWYVTFLNIAAFIYFFQAQSMLVLHALEHTHTHTHTEVSLTFIVLTFNSFFMLQVQNFSCNGPLNPCMWNKHLYIMNQR